MAYRQPISIIIVSRRLHELLLFRSSNRVDFQDQKYGFGVGLLLATIYGEESSTPIIISKRATIVLEMEFNWTTSLLRSWFIQKVNL